MGDVVVGVCYRPPGQKEGGAFSRQLEETSHLQVLVTLTTPISSGAAVQQGRGNARKFPNTGDQGCDKGRCSSGPGSYKQERT